MDFVKATRKRAYMKLALTGPSGSGKTWGALELATGIVGEQDTTDLIALIDTENGSADNYGEDFNFRSLIIQPPFTVQKYIDAINLAVKRGFKIVVIDSLTHAWAGEGGLLEQKEALDKRDRSNNFTNWASITKEHERLKSAMLQAPIDVIATMRSKQEYVLTQGANGKATPQKVGTAPVQRDGMEYEFTIVLDIDAAHQAKVSKDRTGIFAGGIEGMVGRLKSDHGRAIQTWRESGARTLPEPTQEEPAAAPAPPALTRTEAVSAFLTEAKRLDVDVLAGDGRPSSSKLLPLLASLLDKGEVPAKVQDVTTALWVKATERLEGHVRSNAGKAEAPAAPTTAPQQQPPVASDATTRSLRRMFQGEANRCGHNVATEADLLYLVHLILGSDEGETREPSVEEWRRAINELPRWTEARKARTSAVEDDDNGFLEEDPFAENAPPLQPGQSNGKAAQEALL